MIGSAEHSACNYFLANWRGDFLISAQELYPAREVVVQIAVDATQAALLDIFGIFNGGTLTAQVVDVFEALFQRLKAVFGQVDDLLRLPIPQEIFEGLLLCIPEHLLVGGQRRRL